MQHKQTRAVITVDGLAASGKSALCSALAKRLNYVHFSSGALYRAVGFMVLKEGKTPSSSEGVLQLMDQNRIEMALAADNSCKVLINGSDPGEALFSPDVSQATSISSSLREVRQRLLPLQREAFPEKNLVAEGRDMGTVVFPEAVLKFFIVADPAVRAQRRLKQLSQGLSPQEVKLLKEKIEIEISERDLRDTERSESPTKAAKGAILIDNSLQTLTVVVDTMYYHVSERGLPIGSS